jgi:DNA processing protein
VVVKADLSDIERATLVALLRARPRGLSWSRLVSEVLERGSAVAAWNALCERSLFDTEADPAQIDRAAKDIAEWTAVGVGFHTFLDSNYPAQLREIHDMPPVLFSRGAIDADEHAVSVVGSRRASESGLRWARSLAETLVEAGTTVVSGLAEGIDTAAHQATLAAGGRTVAVIGTGINRTYPPANTDLQLRIADEGLVLSQFWPDSPPTKASFPLRNATMSGYGRATVVVEAGETSGARIQARVAVEHGRPVILTDRVVHANEWARQLRQRPGVHVVSTVDEVLAVVAETAADLEGVLAGAFSDAKT